MTLSSDTGSGEGAASSQPPAVGQEPNLPAISLVSKADLDKKIKEEGKAVRLMESAVDSSGVLLIQKYEKLTKLFWQKYRVHPDCRPLLFIAELPLVIIEGINTAFLLPDDIQFLGSYYHLHGNDIVAEHFFNEGIRSETVDAYINFGVFRYRRGDLGVVDNYSLAKRHFNKALGMLARAEMPEDEKNKRRKICVDAVDEIDYRTASFFEKFIRFLIRLLTFHFETAVPFIGGAAPADNPEEKFRQLTESVMAVEFNLKKAAFLRCIEEMHQKIPLTAADLADELHEIETEYGKMETPSVLEIGVSRLGEFYSQNQRILEVREDESRGPGEDAAAPAKEPTLDELIYELANYDEIKKVSEKFKLISVSELIDMASKSNIDKTVIAWLVRDKFDQVAVMEKLVRNVAVPEEMRRMIRHRLPQQPDSE